MAARNKKAEVSHLRFYAPAPLILSRNLVLSGVLSGTPNALAPHRLAPHALAEEEHRDNERYVCEVEHLKPPFSSSPLPRTTSGFS
jgi:hypothetical protein